MDLRTARNNAKTSTAFPKVTDRTMTLYHVTPTYNFVSIAQHGLMRKYSRDVMRAIWLVSQSKLDWAKRHTQVRHGVSHVWVINVHVRRRKLIRYKRGIWRAVIDIPPDRLDYVRPGRDRLYAAYGEYQHVANYYGECPVCRTNDYTDCWGDDQIDEYSISYFYCSNCKGNFNVYDNHEDYRQSFRDDHFDWYYSFDWEFQGD